ncbi:MAG: 3-keto-5-aminohexanoate cleavage protein, partial [Deltaproteobacteria bacterium]|nr:3-keto-5-aminohexanoate cleavage protein [Deltaproteobacteria bacterium]
MAIKIPEDKVIITVAQTGALVTKEMNPNLPEQPDEIIESAYACYNEGATIVHIHGRDKTGENTSNPEIFKEIRDGIREKCNLIIQYSTGGGPNLTQEQRIECLEATPEMASLNMGSLMRISGNYAGIAWSNMPNEIEMYVSRMRELGVKPEMEVHNLAMFRDVNSVIEKGLVDKPYYINLVLGMRYQGACDATPEVLYTLRGFLPDDAIFNCTAVGPAQLPTTTLA